MGKPADEGMSRTETSKSEPSVSLPIRVDESPHQDVVGGVTTVEEIEAKRKSRFAYFKTKDFYLVLALGSV